MTYLALIQAEANAPLDMIVIAQMGNHIMAFNASALYFSKRFSYVAMRESLKQYGDFIKLGFPADNRSRCLAGLTRVLLPEAENTGVEYYRLPNGMTRPDQDAVSQFLSSHEYYHSSREAFRQDALFSEPKNTTTTTTPPPVISIDKVPVPHAEMKFPSEYDTLPVVRIVSRALGYWNDASMKLPKDFRQKYRERLFDILLQIKSTSVFLYENKSFLDRSEQRRVFLRLQEATTALYALVDFFGQQHLLGHNQLQMLIGFFLDLKKNILSWRNHTIPS